MKEFGNNKKEGIREKIESAINDLAREAYPDKSILINVFNNLLRLEEVRDTLVELREKYSKASGIDLGDIPVNKGWELMSDMYLEFWERLKEKRIERDEFQEERHRSLIYKSNRNGIESRYERIIKIFEHMYKTPLSNISIRLNLDREKLEKRVKDEEIRDPLIDKDTWKAKILKALGHYKRVGQLDERTETAIRFFEKYLGLMNNIELIFRNNLSKEEREQIIKSINETIPGTISGLINYQEIAKDQVKDESLDKTIREIVKDLSPIFSFYGKHLKEEDKEIVSRAIIESITPMYILGIPPSIDDKEIKAKREKLAKLVVKRYNPQDSSTQGSINSDEGKNIWNDILVNNLLAQNKKEIYELLGFAIKNREEPLEREEGLVYGSSSPMIEKELYY
ncbi:hypothetical protein J7K74_00285 [Candidatus Woesearchaeota archaeon]|nr:hypothetical protein [Candidatus Woesearchaeota archaeon]